MELVKLIDLLKRRKRFIFTAFLVFYCAVIIGTIFSKAYYKATAQVLVNKGTSVVRTVLSNIGIAGTTAIGGSGDSTSDVYDTDEEMVKNRAILEKTIQQLHLKTRGGKEMKYDKLVSGYFAKLLRPAPHIKAEQKNDSNIIEIKAYSPDPKEAAMMANMVADLFIKEQIRITQDEYGRGRILIEKRMKELRNKYHNALIAVRDYKIQHEYVDLSTETQNILNKIETLKSDLELNNQNIIQAVKRIEMAKIDLKKMSQYRDNEFSYTLNDELKSLRSKLTDALLNLDQQAIDFTPKHPDYKKLEMQIAGVRRLLSEEKKEVLMNTGKSSSIAPLYDQLAKTILDSSFEVELGKATRTIMEKLLAAYEEKLMRIPDITVGKSEVEMELTVHGDSYQNLLGFLAQLEAAETLTLSHIRLIDAAPVPYEPNWPKKMLNLIAGIFVGLFVSLVLAFIVDNMDTSVKSTEDVKRLEKVARVLGTVPELKKKTTRNVLDFSAHGYPTAEPLRSIKNFLGYASPDNPPKSVVVTSALPGEGKSMLAANLAQLFAQEGKKVLLMDLNLRRPTVNVYFRKSGGKGIIGVHSNSYPVESAIVHTDIAGLDILPVGSGAENPSLLVESRWLENFIVELKAGYDMLVIDTPSVSECVDPVVLGVQADKTILVIEYGKTPMAMVGQAKEMFDETHVDMAGIVVNRFSDEGLLYRILNPEAQLT
ncbi:MAG: polysaccharide biosynthesis tyrosine autokinase [Deltaproteobacteria bacterium]|nr:polysaccharide biosynthesis tyrosine autokinase [Deltaproteobacteria bacterium]